MLVASSLLSLSDAPSKRLSMVLRNESKHGITILAKSLIAEVHALQEVSKALLFQHA